MTKKITNLGQCPPPGWRGAQSTAQDERPVQRPECPGTHGAGGVEEKNRITERDCPAAEKKEKKRGSDLQKKETNKQQPLENSMRKILWIVFYLNRFGITRAKCVRCHYHMKHHTSHEIHENSVLTLGIILVTEMLYIDDRLANPKD